MLNLVGNCEITWQGDYDFAPWGYYNTQPADASKYH